MDSGARRKEITLRFSSGNARVKSVEWMDLILNSDYTHVAKIDRRRRTFGFDLAFQQAVISVGLEMTGEKTMDVCIGSQSKVTVGKALPHYRIEAAAKENHIKRRIGCC